MADTQIKNCKQCGCEFSYLAGRKLKLYCSAKCRYIWKDRRAGKKEQQPKSLAPHWVGECVHCKSPMTGRKRKFCGEECRTVYYRDVRPRLLGVMPWDERKALEKASARRADCPHCGFNFHAKASKKGQPQRYCSRRCHDEARRVYSTDIERKAAAKKRYYHRRAQRLGTRPMAEILREAEQKRVSMAQMRATCGTCAAAVESERIRSTGERPGLCGSCLADNKRKSARVCRATRKARERAAKVESFDPLDVLRRDGWLCYICGIDTPKHKRGAYDDDAPEVDHVIPLAAGGEHSMANCRCACRKCNGAKSDRLDFLRAA